ncbi:hypothetical protein MA5S0422_4566 [Mycobacteroides abscessus 5S-0422]|uniref:Uncharacterized protein n=1 Tax=Mycobacteroides abscessus subsp. bolletii 1513 TaxID=1299321 RepID=X8DHN5_9MYCO|nr:hypothetical protein MA5S0422_4566 [Mycobacteroides abscessus 5S-0422]EIU05533.1 hypothetical protein MA5S0421_3649 [Mycobacteroides abscessus 5S-0421]EIU10855.1 hypothetical protein MA5S0304_3395 [Mycobacteroides abscessus 5S-0304]EIU20716.1 hypothetical protein MA5S0708_3320 [Mycobacteroides abscessus 5S-0708]EIU29651.1 hypothetical protein MA5S1212_3076 [Mycobacteroides abscessus 5S-1212]EUA67869.1 hypothetical protein I540_4698 [Mycobacteroides abscessus subsp. bolletii 1513]
MSYLVITIQRALVIASAAVLCALYAPTRLARDLGARVAANDA